MKSGHKKQSGLLFDFVLIIASVLVALLLVKTGIMSMLVTKSVDVEFFGSFIAGMFFTSVFTTAPAIVALGTLAETHNIFATALLGALGAVLGDMIIFCFIRDHFSAHLAEVLSHQRAWKRFHALLKLKFFRRFTFFIGGLIIASPLPDELGISLLGFSKTKTSWFLPLSFTFNFLGILVIGVIARAL